MRKSFKFVSVTLVLVMLALMSLACGKKDDDPAASDGKKNATLDFVWFSDGVEGGVMKDIIKDYEGKKSQH